MIASRPFPALLRRPIVSGAAYGALVYVLMTFVVVPLSAVPRRPFSPSLAAIILGVHIVCVGIPIALAVGRLSVAPNPPGNGHAH